MIKVQVQSAALRRELRRLQVQAKIAQREALQAAGDELGRNLKRAAPVRTGRLRRSTTVSQPRKGAVVVRQGGRKAPYAVFVERATGYFSRALRLPHVRQRVRNAYRDAIRRWLRRGRT